MQSIQDIAAEIVTREGGYVNDPDDPGGATNFGVTLHTLRRLGLDLTRDGRIDEADLRALTRTDAIALFIEHYYHHPGIARLPELLQPSVFDMYVNAGTNAVKILQRLLREMGQTLEGDGLIGAQTVAAAERGVQLAPDHIVDAYAIARRNYYFRLADNRPASRKFARSSAGGKGGWIKRAEAFMAPRFHLSMAEFNARVAAW